MDDPWANAWGEPSNSNSQSGTSLTSNKRDNNADSEADISMPSWSTGPSVKWAEPTFGQGSLWGSAEESPGKLWSTPSPYEEINLGASLQSSLAREPSPSPPPTPKAASPVLPSPKHPTIPLETVTVDEEPKFIAHSLDLDDSATSLPNHIIEAPDTQISPPDFSTSSSDTRLEEIPATTHTKPEPLDLHANAFADSAPFDDVHLSIESRPPEPGSPDGFGSFETGLDSAEVDGDPWAAPIASLSEDAVANTGTEAWASWGSETPNTAESAETEDEWEAAKRNKEMMDRHVPPHVLAGILREFEAFSKELWPDQDAAPTGMQQGWQSGLEGVEGLVEKVDRFAPKDMVLPQAMPFTKTFTGKKLAENLRLTRNLPSTRSSPFNLYLLSKGSTAWETSVKSRIEASEDDVLPAGWRVVEKEEPAKPVEDASKRKSGFLSFFGRRAAEDTGAKKTMASVVGSPTPLSSVSSLSVSEPVRNSGDSNTSNKPPTRPATPSSSLPLPSAPNQIISSAPDSASSQPSLPSTTSDTFDDITPQPQSAVSRFLTRFSRPKGTHSRSPSQSMVLSSDDMDFLSDVVPSLSDDFDDFAQQKELSNMLNSASLSSKLPPPLPPPPKATNPTASTFNVNMSGLSKPSLDDLGDDLLALGSTSQTRSAAPTPPSKSNPPSRQPSISSGSAMPDFSIFDMPPVPTSNPSTIKPPPPSSSNSSSRSASPFTLPPPPKVTAPLANPRKAPTAIMSSGPSKPLTPAAFAPILPPPPTTRTSSVGVTNTSGSVYQTASSNAANHTAALNGGLGDDFSDFFSSPTRSVQPSSAQNTPHSASFDTSESSFFSDFSDKSFVSQQQQQHAKQQNSFDDFDEWTPTSGSLRTPSPPRVPSKQPSYGHKPLEQIRTATPPQMKPLQPMFSGGTPPRQTSPPVHQRTGSLTGSQVSFGNNISRPSSTAPNVLPPPPGSNNSSRSSSTAPGILPPPPGGVPRIPLLNSFSMTPNSTPLSGSSVSRTSSPAPAPTVNAQPLLPAFDAFSTAPAPTKLPITNTLPKLTKAPSLQSNASQGPLSAQDLSFFEGL